MKRKFKQWKSGLTRGVTSLEGNNLMVFHYLSASDNWHGGGSLIRGD